MNKTRRVQFDRYGGPEVLRIEEVTLPELSDDEIRIVHKAIGVNFLDSYYRACLYQTSFPSGFGTEASGVVEAIGKNVAIHSDVAIKLGGTDTALNPHELLEVSLGACTNITVMMYARLKKIPLTDIRTTVEIVNEGEENSITRKIEFVGKLSTEDRERLLEIANKCPMHNFLIHKTVITTEAL